MKIQHAESVALLEEALAYVEYASTDWSDWATEEDNRRKQQRAHKLALRMRALIDGCPTPNNTGSCDDR